MAHLRSRSLFGLVAVLALSASGLSAAVLTDFEEPDANSPFTVRAGFAAGTISTTYAVSGTHSMNLIMNQAMFLPLSDADKGGVLTMMIYDEGRWATGGGCWGPRWGVNDGNWAGAVTIVQRSGLSSANGYGYADGDGLSDAPPYGTWYSPYYHSGPRQVVSLSATSDDASVGEGQWTKWVFEIAEGGLSLRMYRDNVADPNTNLKTATFSNPITEIFLYGGRNSTTAGYYLAGMYVDDVTWTPLPEPGTMALLAAGGLALLRRRRRK